MTQTVPFAPLQPKSVWLTFMAMQGAGVKTNHKLNCFQFEIKEFGSVCKVGVVAWGLHPHLFPLIELLYADIFVYQQPLVD